MNLKGFEQLKKKIYFIHGNTLDGLIKRLNLRKFWLILVDFKIRSSSKFGSKLRMKIVLYFSHTIQHKRLNIIIIFKLHSIELEPLCYYQGLCYRLNDYSSLHKRHQNGEK